MRNVSQSQFAYDALLKEAKCPDLTCLREMDAVKFQEAARNLRMPFPSGQDPPLYFWNPTLDHGFIQDYTFNEISAGKFVKVPSIFGDTANEGWVFTPQSITSGPRAEQFLQDQFTNLNEQEKAQILRLWEAPYEGRLDPKWKKIASDVYGHIRYTCGALNISAAIAANGSAPVWQYRWNVGEALHVSELPAIWNGGASAAAVFMQHYLVSFVRSYDPNRFPSDFSLQNGATLETPGWKEFGHETAEQKRMHFGNDNAVHMREVSPEEAIRCDALLNMGIQLEQ
jgi:carboxylesterase type B